MAQRNSNNSGQSSHVSRRPRSVYAWLAVVFGMSLMLADQSTATDTGQKVTLETNQQWIESLNKSAKLEIHSLEDALDIVFYKLPDRVFVYPTENYYYYRLSAGGVVYAGNLRLAAQDRDSGIIHFAIFKQANQASEAGEISYKALGPSDGVQVKKVAELVYRVTRKGKSVLFQLNDVSGIVPPAAIVAAGEEYLGQVYDESGIKFFLFYNRAVKVFAYVLDETGAVLDQFEPIAEGSRILVGHRSGFAVYQHHHLDRKILVGVHGANTVVNNYYDGPADQLPENHIKDDNLRKAIVDSDPKMKDQLDEFGYFKTGEGRYLIAPYAQYIDLEELTGYDECANDPKVALEQYDGCFFSGEQ